jgi:hypothetical protein
MYARRSGNDTAATPLVVPNDKVEIRHRRSMKEELPLQVV